MSTMPVRRSKIIAEQVGDVPVPVKKTWEEQQLLKTVKQLQSKNEKLTEMLKETLDHMVDRLVETECALEKEKAESAVLRKTISELKTRPIECEICAQQYGDTGMSVPRVLPCGHTVCSECVGHFIYGGLLLKCPFDRKGFLFVNKTIEDLPKNYSLINQ